MSKKKTLRCAIYTRKSTEEGLDQDFNSLQAQREACTAYVISQTHEGWEALPTLYDDGGFSGGSMDRPGLEALIQDIEQNKIDIVVVYKVDRLTRSLADFAKLVDVFDTHDVSFVSVTQAFNTTSSMGRLTLNVLLSFAQFEREVTAERIRDKFKASKEKGMWMGGRPPLGYDIDNRKLVINREEASRVRYIFESYIKLGSAMALMTHLKEQGLHSKRWTTQKDKVQGGHPFTRGALYTLLQNPVYIGKIRHKDQTHEGLHDPIIDPTLWGAAQKLLSTNRHAHRTKSNSKNPSLLAGLLIHEDGQPFKTKHTRKNGIRHRYYTHPTQTLPAHEIETLVTNEVSHLLEDPVQLKQVLNENDPKELETLLKKAATKSQQPPDRHTLQTLLNKVAIAPDQIKLHINPAGLRTFLTEQTPVTQDTSPSYVLTRTVTLKRCGHGKKLIVGGTKTSETRRADPSLLKTILRAHAWLEELTSGESYKEIATQEKIDQRLVARTIRLAFLAPDITSAILSGIEPSDLTSQKLIRLPDLPADWDDQRQLLGFI
jgi:site-specific DNA recombinase